MEYRVEDSRLLLRTVRLEDVNANYERWMNDPVVMQYTESRFAKHTQETIKDYVLSVLKDPTSVFLAIIEKESGRHIGNLKIGHINSYHRFADVGIIIGERDCWGKGYAANALRLSARLAREQLGLHKLWAGIYVTNAGSVQAFLKAGFVAEGRFLSHWLTDEGYVDGLHMGLVLEEKT